MDDPGIRGWDADREKAVYKTDETAVARILAAEFSVDKHIIQCQFNHMGWKLPNVGAEKFRCILLIFAARPGGNQATPCT